MHYLLTSHIKCFSQPGSKGTTNARWPGCGAANINNGENQSKLFIKNWQHAKKPRQQNKPKPKTPPFWQPQRKQDLICELLTSHTHSQNSKQLIFPTNNSTSSTCCQSKAWEFKHLYKKQQGELQCNSAYRMKAGDNTCLGDLHEKIASVGK